MSGNICIICFGVDNIINLSCLTKEKSCLKSFLIRIKDVDDLVLISCMTESK